MSPSESLKDNSFFEVQTCSRCGEETIATMEVDEGLICLSCAEKAEEQEEEGRAG
jgi:formylmethanofuran dehydrogenase subunit E